MTSWSHVISVIKNWNLFNCQHVSVPVVVHLSLAGAQGNFRTVKEADSMKSHVPDCCCLHFPVYQLGTNVVLFTYQTPLSPLLFLSCWLFSLSPTTTLQDSHFLVNETTAVFWASCFPVEFSLNTWRGQCVCRSGWGLWRSGQETRAPKTCWRHGCQSGQTAQ